MSDYTLYHNPRCSKSRGVCALLDERGIDVTIIPYLEQAPTTATILDLAGKLGLPVRALIRQNEALFRESFGDQEHDDAGWAAIIAANPQLLQRPILVKGDRAVIGRPPESVLSLIDQ